MFHYIFPFDHKMFHIFVFNISVCVTAEDGQQQTLVHINASKVHVPWSYSHIIIGGVDIYNFSDFFLTPFQYTVNKL